MFTDQDIARLMLRQRSLLLWLPQVTSLAGWQKAFQMEFLFFFFYYIITNGIRGQPDLLAEACKTLPLLPCCVDVTHVQHMCRCGMTAR